MNPAREKGFCHNFRRYTREYSEVTGIHGLRYVTEKRSRTEKIIWTIFLLVSLGGCIYMIYEILYKYNNSPVVVSFATEDTPLFKIPFPAVTICPETRYSRDDYNYTDVFLRLYYNQRVEEQELKTFHHLSLICDENYSGKKYYAPQTVGNEFFDTLDSLKPDVNSLLRACKSFDSSFQLCTEFFKPLFTDTGVCYSYNILDRQEIFRKHVFHYGDYGHIEHKSAEDFSVESGYKPTSGINVYPRRAFKSGMEHALYIIFNYDTNQSDFACNNLLEGFRVAIHNPWELPIASSQFFPIPFGKVVFAAMNPEMIETSEQVRRFNPEKRKCFMADERPLKHFKLYSQSHCFLECTTNFTLNKCGCVEFYMPREEGTPICGPASRNCTEEAEAEITMREVELQVAGSRFCDCKPSCTDLKFNVETSLTDFNPREYFRMVDPDIGLVDDGTHWSLLAIYFKDEQFITKERNELYGISDLISNLGGLLGLFTGFSLISAIELIYFCSLRIFYNERMYGVWAGPPA